MTILAATSVAAAQPAFDVASIKPSKPELNTGLSLSHGRLHGSGVKLRELIGEAYQVTESQVSGLPEWATTEAYVIDAKSEKNSSVSETRGMLLELLASRFQLKLHRERKEMTAYTLSVESGKAGKLVRADGEGCESEPAPANPCQRVEITPEFVVTGTRISMGMFCKVLEKMLFNRVVDQTGLEGVYDVKLDLPKEGFNSGTDGLTATVLALRNQLGLKLERGKGEMEVLVIEHVERPSGN